MASLPRRIEQIDELHRAVEEAEHRFETALRRCEQLGARAVRARVLYERATRLQAVPEALFRREGEYWTIAYAGSTCRLKDLKGLRCIAFLLGAPRREVHALELAAAADGLEPRRTLRLAEAGLQASATETVALVDARAKEAYRRRLEELGDDLRQARDWRDPERVKRIEEEIDALTAELARAAGLGGRDRRPASPAERARVSVTKAIRAAIKAIDKHHAALGEHLAASVHTGRLCSYAPPGETPPRWTL